jgi:3-oxoacyl-[acyl-carrier protein] reductase
MPCRPGGAKRLAASGARVAVADLNLHSFEEFDAEAQDMTGDSTVAEIKAAGGTALGLGVDVTDNEAVTAIVACFVQGLGACRCLRRECRRRSGSADGHQSECP